MRTARLGDVCEKIGSGATPRGGSDVYLTSGVALIRSQNVYNDGFKKEGMAFIDKIHADELSNVTIQFGDVLLNITGDSVARVCQVPNEVLPARVNQHVAIIRPNKNDLDARYLRYFLVSPQMQQQMLAFAAAGATRNALTKGMIESFEVPAPPVPEQKAIAHVLGSLDDKIELNRKMNETLEAMARAIFKSWFVDFDPVRAKAEGREPAGMDAETAALFPDSFEETELGVIPSGWKVGHLGDVAENSRRGIGPSQIPSATPYIGLEHMPCKSIALNEWAYSDGLESNKFQFDRGNILFGKLRPYFHKVGVASINGVCSTDILVIVPKQNYWLAFLLGHVSSDSFIDYTNSASTGTKMPRTNWQDMARYDIVIPSEPIVRVLNSKIRPMIEMILSNISQFRTLSIIRDTLLPKLLSGEIRAKEMKLLEIRS